MPSPRAQWSVCCQYVIESQLDFWVTLLQVVILVVDQQQRPELPQDLMALPGSPLRRPGPYLELMQQCWATDPAQRPSFERVISLLRYACTAQSQAAAHVSACRQKREGRALQLECALICLSSHTACLGQGKVEAVSSRCASGI